MSEELMAKENWEEHKKRYVEEYPGLTLAAYAAMFGLNPSTARRAMRGVTNAAKGKVSPQPKCQEKTDHNAENDHLPSDHFAERERQSATHKKEEKTIKSGRYIQKTAHEGGRVTRQNDFPNVEIPRVENTGNDHLEIPTYLGDKLVSCMEPLTAQNHTGGYVSFLNMDADILLAARELTQGDEELVLAHGRYIQLYRCQQNARKQVIKDYAKNEAWDYPGTDTPMPQEMALLQVELAPAQRFIELERYIGSRKSTLWRQQQAVQEHFTMQEQQALTTEILLARIEHGWSALKTAQELELLGLSLPWSLGLEVAREVSFIEPVADTEGGISDAELEAQAQAYMADQKEVMGNWLPQRQAEVAKALANEIAHQHSELIDEDDFNPLPADELPDTRRDEDREPLTDVAEVWN